MTDEKNKRIAVIDYLRAFAITAVVVLHLPTVDFSLSANTPAYQFELAIKTASESLAIPFFILLSGLSLAIKYTDFNINRFYLKRLKTIVGPYLFFSIFYLVYRYINNDNLSFSSAISSIFNGSSFYHLWFMILIPQYYLLYPVIIRIYKRITKKSQQRLITLSLLMQIIWWMIALNISADAYYPEIKLMYSMIFMSSIFYFLLGIYIGTNFSDINRRIERVRIVAPALVVFTCMILVLTYVHLDIMMKSGGEILSSQHILDWVLGPIIVVSGLVVLNKLALILDGKISAGLKLLGLIGQYSFGIYLIHPFFIQIIKTNTYLHFGLVMPDIALFCLTMMASIFVVYLLSLLPFGKYLVGVGSNKSRA